MPIYAYAGIRPVIDESAFVHPEAVDRRRDHRQGVLIAPCASLRGDMGRLIVGDGANIQDGCVMHGFPGKDCAIEEDGHIGHGAILHGCRIGRNALVGMNAVVMDGATVGQDSFVAAMAFVKAGFVPPCTLVAGMPARIVRELTDQEIAWKRSGTRVSGTRTALYTELVPCEPLRGSRARSQPGSIACRNSAVTRDQGAECSMMRCRRMVGTIAHRSLLPASMQRLRHWRLLIRPATVRRPSRAGGGVQPILRLDPVSKTFPGVRALDSVQFDVRPGEVHALLGENGAGKSTLIKIMSGVHEPDGGTVELDGKPVRSAGRRMPSGPASPRSTRNCCSSRAHRGREHLRGPCAAAALGGSTGA